MIVNKDTNQCKYIHKNNERCKRIIAENEIYCWKHMDMEISELLESMEFIENLPADIIKYTLNQYIDYFTESELIEILTGAKLNIDSNLTYENEYYKN
jgi:hypothetical protein